MRDIFQMNGIERPTREGASPVIIRIYPASDFQSTARHVKPCRKLRRPLRKAKYQYREGKVKRTPGGE